MTPSSPAAMRSSRATAVAVAWWSPVTMTTREEALAALVESGSVALIVPGHPALALDAASAQPDGVDRVLLAVDRSGHAEEAVRVAGDLASALGVEVRVLHVLEAPLTDRKSVV